MSRKQTILVVDDQPGLCQAFTKVLVKEGYRALSSTSVSSALKTLKKEKIGLVLLDLKMPKKNGLEVLRIIRKSWPLMPVIMMTAYSTLDAARKAMTLGATDYLTKPFDLDELRAVVKEALE